MSLELEEEDEPEPRLSERKVRTQEERWSRILWWIRDKKEEEEQFVFELEIKLEL